MSQYLQRHPLPLSCPPSLFFPLVSFAFVLVVLYTIYGAVYRLYFSPIAKFPDPRVAALTFWDEVYYDVVQGGRYTWKIGEYHQVYGK